MAGSDYANCDACGKGKIFYDANVDWQNFGDRIGQIRIVCSECWDKGERLLYHLKQEQDLVHNWGIHSWTSEGKLLLNPSASEKK